MVGQRAVAVNCRRQRQAERFANRQKLRRRKVGIPVPDSAIATSNSVLLGKFRHTINRNGNGAGNVVVSAAAGGMRQGCRAAAAAFLRPVANLLRRVPVIRIERQLLIPSDGNGAAAAANADGNRPGGLGFQRHAVIPGPSFDKTDLCRPVGRAPAGRGKDQTGLRILRAQRRRHPQRRPNQRHRRNQQRQERDDAGGPGGAAGNPADFGGRHCDTSFMEQAQDAGIITGRRRPVNRTMRDGFAPVVIIIIIAAAPIPALCCPGASIADAEMSTRPNAPARRERQSD